MELNVTLGFVRVVPGLGIIIHYQDYRVEWVHIDLLSEQVRPFKPGPAAHPHLTARLLSSGVY